MFPGVSQTSQPVPDKSVEFSIVACEMLRCFTEHHVLLLHALERNSTCKHHSKLSLLVIVLGIKLSLAFELKPHQLFKLTICLTKENIAIVFSGSKSYSICSYEYIH